MSNNAYFTTDGTYGSANDGDIVILDVSGFTGDDWDEIDTAADSKRMQVAQRIAKKRSK